MNAENDSPGATGTSEDHWRRYRAWLYVNRELDFYLDLSRMHLASDIDRRMASDFERAFAAMDALEAGEIAWLFHVPATKPLRQNHRGSRAGALESTSLML